MIIRQGIVKKTDSDDGPAERRLLPPYGWQTTAPRLELLRGNDCMRSFRTKFPILVMICYHDERNELMCERKE